MTTAIQARSSDRNGSERQRADQCARRAGRIAVRVGEHDDPGGAACTVQGILKTQAASDSGAVASADRNADATA